MTDTATLIRALSRDELSRHRFPELGIVTQVFSKTSDDGKENHQVAVKLPTSDVEMLRANVIVGRLGLSALPRVGDVVLVVFIGGDLNAPIVVGSLYDHQNHPPKAADGEIVYHVPDGDPSDVRRIHLETPNGTTVTLEDETLSIVMGDTSIEVKRDGDVTIKASGAISLTASGDLTLESQGSVKISGQQKVEVSAVQLTLEGQGTASLKGAQVSIGGITQFSPS